MVEIEFTFQPLPSRAELDARANLRAGDEITDKQCVTVGRKKRKRKRGAGSAVKIKSHTRSPRGSNKGKKPVRVDGYKRGKPPKKGRRRKK
jgi:hypothetical protein